MTRTFSFLTCGFVHGAYQSQGFNRPELRTPSVKGQLRWWFDALIGDQKAEQRLFGYVSSRENSRLGLHGNESSRVIVRVRPRVEEVSLSKVDYMPHKGSDGGTKNAIPPGTKYEISLLARRDALSDEQQAQLERVLDAWLLLGAVGQRSNRGAGSIWPDDTVFEPEAYLERARSLLAGSKLRCALLGHVYATEVELRYEAGDFLQAPTMRVTRRSRQVDIAEPWWPFGAAEDRKPSPLKLGAALLGGKLRLVAIWDGRHHTSEDLRNGVAQLSKHKEIGRQLDSLLSELCA